MGRYVEQIDGLIARLRKARARAVINDIVEIAADMHFHTRAVTVRLVDDRWEIVEIRMGHRWDAARDREPTKFDIATLNQQAADLLASIDTDGVRSGALATPNRDGSFELTAFFNGSLVQSAINDVSRALSRVFGAAK